MTTVEILPISDENGQTSYRAVAGDKQSVGRTAGQALDALTAQLIQTDFNGLFFIRDVSPDRFFSTQQQERLSTLMDLWRQARDRGKTLSTKQQAELDTLVEFELNAATARTIALMQPEAE